MIFYSVYFWILLMAFAFIRMKLPRNGNSYLMLLSAINLIMIFISGPVSFIFLISLITLMLLLNKITKKWVAFVVTLIIGIFLKNYLAQTLPLSVSYFMLAILGLIYRSNEIEPQLFSTAFLFPLAEVGPIVRAEEIARTLNSPFNIKTSFITILAGFICISLGSSQSAIIDQKILNSADLILHFFSVLNFMFLNFQGAVLIALGSAELLGFKVAPNFNSPYFASSMRDFWGRWHISMGRFFSEHIFQPMQLVLSSKIRKPTHANMFFVKMFSLLTTWLLIAFWHKSTWSFFIWGLYNAILISIPMDTKKSNLVFLNVFLTLLLVWIGHTLFLSADLLSFKNFLLDLVHLKLIPEHLQMAKIMGILFNIILFYISQKIFFWKEKIFEYLNKHSFVYYALLVAMFFVALVYHYKGQIIVYGQF